MNTTTNNPAMALPASNIKFAKRYLDSQISILRTAYLNAHLNVATKDDDIAVWKLSEAILHLESVVAELDEVLGRLQ